MSHALGSATGSVGPVLLKFTTINGIPMNGKSSSLLLVALVSIASASQSYAEVTTYRYTDLGTLGGTDSSATAINNAGVVAGWARTATGYAHATVWNVGEAYTISNTAAYATLCTGTKATPTWGHWA